MNKTLNNDNSKPPRRIDTAGCRSSLTDGSTINKEEAKRNRKERQDGLSRRVLSTLCPCWTALATVRPEHATELVKRGASVACGLPLANWADARKERVRSEEPCRRIHSRFGEIFLRTPPSAAAQEREPSLRVLPTGHQVLLTESLDEIGTQVLAE